MSDNTPRRHNDAGHSGGLKDRHSAAGPHTPVVGVTLIDPNECLYPIHRKRGVLGPGAHSDTNIALDLGPNVHKCRSS